MTGPESATLPTGTRRPDPTLLAGGRFEIERLLGEGTSKAVYQARDRRLERDVALAVIADAGRRVLHEVRAMARLDHTNIVTVFDVGEEHGETFIVSKLVRGGSVAHWIGRTEPGAARVRDAVQIARQIAAALAHAHAAGIVHRDVKPGNVLLAADGTALLADFGVAVESGSTHDTADGAVVGTVAYMAPEQALGRRVDARCDLYALGATLFEMVYGRPPFEGKPLAILAKLLHEPPPDPRELDPPVPPRLAALIERLLAKEPDDRPASAAEVDEQLAEVLAEPDASARAPAAAPLPPPLEEDARRPFVGRQAALDALREAWQATRPGLTLVSGEAGIGKTALAGAFAREVHAEGALVLFGRCDEAPFVSYQPFVEALRHLLSHRPDLERRLDPRLEPELAELSRLVPELRGPGREPAAADDDQARPRLFEAVVALLSAAARRWPLLLVLDDVQWADPPTALLLAHVLRASGKNTMVLATERTGELRPAPAGVRHRVALAGLDESETEALVGVRGSGAADPEFVRGLRKTTSGNPFFIEEMLSELGDSGRSSGSLASLGVPRGAQEVIRRRLARLSPEAAALLADASVCGHEFRLDVLTELLGVPAGQLKDPLKETLAAGLVVEPRVGRFAFFHALVRETLYEDIGLETDRAERHLAVGEALQRLDGDGASASELALHFYAARALGGADRAVRYARAAAAGAAEAFAYEEAARHEGDALTVLEELGERYAERFEVIDSLGRLQLRAGAQADARATYARKAALAREVGDSHHLADAARGFAGRYYDAEEINPELVALLEEARSALPADEVARRARLTARLSEAVRVSDPDRSASLSEEALALAQSTGDEDALIDALACRHYALSHPGHLPERLEVGARWVELAERAGERDDAFAGALYWRIYDLFEAGDIAASRSELARLREFAERLREPLYRHYVTAWDYKWLALAGRFRDAAAHSEASYKAAREAERSYADSMYAGHAYGMLRSRGRWDKVLRMVEEVMPATPTLPAWRAAIVVTRARTGDRAHAQAELSALVAGDFSAVPRDEFWLGTMCVLAEACAALGDTAVATGLSARLAPYAEMNAQLGLALFLGPVRLFTGLLHACLGETAAAEDSFQAAIERAGALGARTVEAHALCEHGELLLRGGAPERARERLARSLAIAAELGMSEIERRAREGLEHAG